MWVDRQAVTRVQIKHVLILRFQRKKIRWIFL